MTVDTGTAILKFANSDIGQLIIKLTLAYTTINLVNKGLKTFTKFQGISVLVSQFKDLTASAGLLKGSLALIGSYLSPFLVGGAVIVGIYAIYKAINDTEGRLQKANDTLAETKNSIKEVSGEYEALSSKGDNLNKAEKARLEYLEKQLENLKEQAKIQGIDVGKKALADYSSTKDIEKTKRQGGSDYKYIVNVEVKGQEALDNTVNKIKELDKAIKDETITNTDFINKKQELVQSLDNVWLAYEDLIKSGQELTPEQQANARAIAEMNIALNEAGGKSNVLNVTMQNYVATLQGKVLPITKIFRDSLIKEGDGYKWINEQAKTNAKAVIQAEIDKTNNLIKQAKARLQIAKTEQEGMALLNVNNPMVNLANKKAQSDIGRLKKILSGNLSQLDKINAMGVGSTSQDFGNKTDKTTSSSKADEQARKSSEISKKALEEKLANLKTISGYTEKNRRSFLAYLKKQRKEEKITYDEFKDYQNQYYNIRSENYVKDYENNKKSLAKSKHLLYEYVKSGKIKWSEYHKYIDQLNDLSAEKYKQSLEKQQDVLEAKLSAMDWYAKQQQNAIDKRIEALQSERAEIEKQNQAREDAIELQRLEQNLAEAKAKKVRIYRGGKGFVYEQDVESVSLAQKEIDDKKAEQLKNAQLDRADQEIESLENEKQAWSDYVSDYGELQDKLETEQTLGMTYEKFIQDNRITNIATFTEQYRQYVNEQIELAKMLAQAMEEMSMGGGGGGNFESYLAPELLYGLSKHDKHILGKYQYVTRDKYGVLHGSNVSQDKVNSISNNANKKPPKKPSKKGYASGSNAIPRGGVYKFNELGNELSIPPNINYAPKGTGIVPHTMSENLKEIGMYNLSGLKNYMLGNQGKSDMTSISIANLNLEKISNVDSLINELKKFKNQAIQKSYSV